MGTVDQAVTGGAETGKRSSASGMAGPQLDLWPGLAGGGGSAGGVRAPARGGGYPNICTASEVRRAKRAAGAPRDPRLDDLRAARLGPVWLRVAERIGFEAFMQVWQTLSSFPGVGDDRNRVYVPCIEKFLATQRNLLMRELIAQGLSSTQIRQELVRRLGAAPALNTITKAMSRVRRAS